MINLIQYEHIFKNVTTHFVIMTAFFHVSWQATTTTYA
jgi:hypothetical protein